jgi:hypothetical protein
MIVVEFSEFLHIWSIFGLSDTLTVLAMGNVVL